MMCVLLMYSCVILFYQLHSMSNKVTKYKVSWNDNDKRKSTTSKERSRLVRWWSSCQWLSQVHYPQANSEGTFCQFRHMLLPRTATTSGLVKLTWAERCARNNFLLGYRWLHNAFWPFKVIDFCITRQRTCSELSYTVLTILLVLVPLWSIPLGTDSGIGNTFWDNKYSLLFSNTFFQKFKLVACILQALHGIYACTTQYRILQHYIANLFQNICAYSCIRRSCN